MHLEGGDVSKVQNNRAWDGRRVASHVLIEERGVGKGADAQISVLVGSWCALVSGML